MSNRFICLSLIAVLLFSIAGCSSCRRKSNSFSIVLTSDFTGVDPNIRQDTDASAERLRQLMFNSLVKKNEKFDYVPELAKEINRSEDGLTYTFTLHDNIKFHNGQPLTSADVKYTFDTLLQNPVPKSTAIQPYVKAIEAPAPNTAIIRLYKPWLSLLSNLVAIAIIPQGTAEKQKDTPIGSGPFKFVRKEGNTLVELERFQDYWEGAAQIERLVVKVVKDANALQAELKSGNTSIAPLPINLTADALNTLAQDQNLQVKKFPGANLVYLGFNTKSTPFDNVKVRQAIAYAVNRNSIVNDLLKGQAIVAHSILPEESWAYSANLKYSYDPAKAKQLLDEAGFKDPDGDGQQMRFQNEISLKISSGNLATSQFAQVIQQSLKQVGIPVKIEPFETGILLGQLRKGQFQLTISNWIGGNQDPIFLKDLFASTESTDVKPNGFNRSRYNNPHYDTIVNEAINTVDRAKALELYTKAQEIIASDVPQFPLWYPANMVVAQKYVGNIKVDGSGDWSFVRLLTSEKK